MLGSRNYSHPTAAEILAHCDTINEYASAADVPQTCTVSGTNFDKVAAGAQPRHRTC
jgi:hypothetical protein